MWWEKIPSPEVAVIAHKHGLELNVVMAVIQVESAGNPFAVRAEMTALLDQNGRQVFMSRWHYPFHPKEIAEKLGCTVPTEKVFQATSFGPMQIMGAVAREHGFTGWLTELCSWSLGTEFGCRHLRKMRDRYGEDPATLYAAYNAGSPRKTPGGMFENQRNVDRFMTFYREIEESQYER